MGAPWATCTLALLWSLIVVNGFSDIPIQYHIQTDVGPVRYFRYQTYDGQYRNEKRLGDGTVIGAYAWVDPTGLLRRYDYVADTGGYKIVRTKSYPAPAPPATPSALPVRKNPLKTSEVELSSNQIESDPVTNTRYPVLIREEKYSPQETGRAQQEAVPPDAEVQTPRPEKITQGKSDLPKLRPLLLRQKAPQSQQLRKSYVPKFKKQMQPFGGRQKSIILQAGTSNILTVNTVKRRPQPLTRAQPAVLKDRLATTTSSPSPKSIDPGILADGPGGRVTVNYHLGNQYRKEKVFPDGTVVGEHGYVDPLGILRITYFTSGPKGHHERKESRWVGSRLPTL